MCIFAVGKMRSFCKGISTYMLSALSLGCSGAAFETAALRAEDAAGSAGSTGGSATTTGGAAGAAGSVGTGGAAGGSGADGAAGSPPRVDAGSDAPAAEASPSLDGGRSETCVPRNQCNGENCGDKDDGCGGKWHCGDCTGTDQCGTAGIPNVCNTCVPKTCGELGFACGVRDNGCGAPINCGACAQNSACGAGLNPKVCGQWIQKCSDAPTPDNSVCMSMYMNTWHVYCSMALLMAHHCNLPPSPSACPMGGVGCDPATLSGL